MSPSRWGYAAAAATTDLQGFPFTDPLWIHDVGNWWRNVIILGLQVATLLAATRWALIRSEPNRT